MSENAFKFIKPRYKWNYKCVDCGKWTSTTVWKRVQIGLCAKCRKSKIKSYSKTILANK